MLQERENNLHGVLTCTGYREVVVVVRTNKGKEGRRGREGGNEGGGWSAEGHELGGSGGWVHIIHE